MHAARRTARAASPHAGWVPVVVLAAGAAVPAFRPAVLVALVAAALANAARRRTGTPLGRAMLATLPAAVGLTWAGIAGTPMPLADALRCTDPTSPPTVNRVAEALLVLGILGTCSRLTGDRAALLLRRPSDRRVTALALAAPLLLVPGALWIGPLVARPFFGDVGFSTSDPRALVPAVAFAVANAALEENSYRGALLGWSRPALGPTAAVLAQAVVFGFAHLGADVTGPAPLLWLGMTASGVAAGLIAVRTSSLLLPFTVHAALDVPLYYAYACRAVT
jgi:membrane protease YdiL (CAAX protease family)